MTGSIEDQSETTRSALTFDGGCRDAGAHAVGQAGRRDVALGFEVVADEGAVVLGAARGVPGVVGGGDDRDRVIVELVTVSGVVETT